MARSTPHNPDMYLQVIAELKDSISAQIADLKEYVREDSRRVHDQQARYDVTVKAEFAQVKSMFTDMARTVASMATKDEVTNLVARVTSLEADRSKAEGAWWLLIKASAVVVLLGACFAWVWENILSKPPVSQ